MIRRLRMIETADTNPYRNLALEEFLLEHEEPETCVLYLWQNRRTVVIGRNQNSFGECRIEQLEMDGGYLARRLSGGGAVFHDLGNLNFTFLARKEDYDISRQTEVILTAALALGIQAEKNGRNDITVDGRKFSGNAYFQTGDFCCHHGTLLVDVDKESMSRYLNVSQEKLWSKSVESVKSRVANLTEYIPGLTIGQVREAMAEAFVSCYGLRAEVLEPEEIDWRQVEKRQEFFASWEWKYGRRIPFTNQFSKRFFWGGVEAALQVNEGRIKAAVLSSDGLDVEFLGRLEERMIGIRYRSEELARCVRGTPAENELQETMRSDIGKFFEEGLSGKFLERRRERD